MTSPQDPLQRQLTSPALYRLLQATELLRKLDREMPGQVVATFLYVASHNPCHKQALEEDLEFTTASASRNTDWLSNKHRLRKPGLGLVRKFRDPANNRRAMLELTDYGHDLCDKLVAVIN